MRKTIKNLALALLSVTFFVMATVGILTNSNVKSAIAEANPVAVENNFETQNGASIRIAKGGQPSGVRWAVKVTEEFHKYVSALGTPTYYTLVNTEAIDEDGLNDKAVKIACTANPKFDKNGEWTFYASIVYDQLAAELKAEGYTDLQVEQLLVKAYETELYARAYVEIDNNDSATKIFSVEGDTARSIKNVATYCLISGDTDADNKATFETIAGKTVSIEKTETQKAMKVESVYAEKQPNGADFEALASGTVKSQSDLPAGTYDVLVGAKQVDTITLESAGVATATISGLASDAYEAGKDYYAQFVAGDGKVYQIPFRYATAIIDDGADFSPFSVRSCDECDKCLAGNKGGCSNPQAPDVIEDRNSYFIMSKDVLGSVTGAASYVPNAQSPVYVGLGGTFDGNGYAVRGAELPHCGLFDLVNGGTIKNFAIIDCTLTLWGPIALAAQLNGATLDNVYIDVKYAFNSGAVRAPSVFNACDNETKITNTVIKTNYTPFSGQDVTSTYGMLNEVYYIIYQSPYAVNYDKMLENAENLYYVSANTYITSTGGADSMRWYGANETDLYNSENIKYKKQFTGVYHYADGAALATAVTELPAGFSADLWKIDATLGLAWK